MAAELLQRYNPARPLNWRQQRAYQIVNSPEPAWGVEDAPTLAYCRYLRKLNRATSRGTLAAFDSLYHDNPGIVYADGLRRHRDTRWQAMFEGRILANQGNQEIADLYGTIPATVRDYESIFFNVRDRLTCRDWMFRSLTGPLWGVSDQMGVYPRIRRDVSLRLFAWFGGPKVLEAVAFGMEKQSFPETSRDVQDWFTGTYESLLRAKSTVALRELEVNKYNVMGLLTLYSAFTERLAKDSGGPATAYEEHLQELVSGITWQTERQAQENNSATILKIADTGYEPRAKEAQAKLAGKPTLDLAKLERPKLERPTLAATDKKLSATKESAFEVEST